ncbi:MAG: hypothetical protein ABI660_04490 [Polaromonas sp.]
MATRLISTLALLAVWVTNAHAGFGGMGAVDSEPGSGDSILGLVACALVGAAVGWAFAQARNSTAETKVATDGCMIFGVLGGLLLAPLVAFLLR